ncbi:beta-galactosidase, partial [Paenibacillus sp. MCAF20]
MLNQVMQRKEHLLVDQGRPFIMLAGEVHNSSSSSAEYMEPIWEKAVKLGLNSLLLPVTWEMVEPEEGVFDFRLVDELIGQARRHGMRIGFLWFGAWKNAQCYYAPSWVKTDMERFQRAEVEKGKKKTNLKDFHGMSYT